MEKLTFEETRVIGALIEKKYSTPDYYPLTVNSLTNACNQKSSREPVVNFSNGQVEEILSNLREKHLVSLVTGGDSRVPKYSEIFSQHFSFSLPQTALIAVLFLRGPQTVGELRGRTSRIYNFEDLGEVHTTLDSLQSKESESYITKLPKTSGREHRYAHLFCGEPELAANGENSVSESDSIMELSKKIESLSNELNQLKEDFINFKKAFE